MRSVTDASSVPACRSSLGCLSRKISSSSFSTDRMLSRLACEGRSEPRVRVAGGVLGRLWAAVYSELAELRVQYILGIH